MQKKIFICSNCGFEHTKWSGSCSSCGKWNCLEEKIIEKISKGKMKSSTPAKTKNLGEIKNSEEKDRIKTCFSEFDRVLGGGILPGSTILLTGDPGIGKSTLTLQSAGNIGKTKKVLIVSGEESVNQISSRAERLDIKSKNISLLNTNSLETALSTAKSENPDLLITDSIQMMFSEDTYGNSGGISQVRNAIENFVSFAKTTNIPTILIGHVTKEGEVAGPRVLEHLVDVVINLEGERYQNFRLLRGLKNRFGATDEVGILEMTGKGLRDVKNPSMDFLSGLKEGIVGNSVFAAIEGSRSFLIETQSLTSESKFGYPRRTAEGISINKLHILCAVLVKHANIKIENFDVYIKVVGGFKLKEPASDLSVALSIASSRLNRSMPQNTAVFGEIGLSGELRSVMSPEKRIKEIESFGFKKVFCPPLKKKIKSNLEIYEFETLNEAIIKGLVMV